jgi:hypothetical protein
MRIHELAKERGIVPGEMLRTLKSKGFKAYMFSTVSDEMIEALGPNGGKPEPEVQVAKDRSLAEPPANGTKYYYAKSERLMLGGCIPEKRGIGYVESDRPIQFENHLYITADEHEQRFIESCDRFSIGDISLTDQEGHNRTMQELADRRNRMKEDAARMSGISR